MSNCAEGRRVTAALLLDVPDEEVVKRISGRRVCNEGRAQLPRRLRPAQGGRHLRPGRLELIQRDDDKPEVIRNRLRVYHEQT